jgi:hypothetical protein
MAEEEDFSKMPIKERMVHKVCVMRVFVVSLTVLELEGPCLRL